MLTSKMKTLSVYSINKIMIKADINTERLTLKGRYRTPKITAKIQGLEIDKLNLEILCTFNVLIMSVGASCLTQTLCQSCGADKNYQDILTSGSPWFLLSHECWIVLHHNTPFIIISYIGVKMLALDCIVNVAVGIYATYSANTFLLSGLLAKNLVLKTKNIKNRLVLKILIYYNGSVDDAHNTG